MAELMTFAVAAEILEQFRLAWRARIADKDLEPTARLWLQSLTGLTAESVRAAAKRAIQSGEHFPRVKEIREAALQFMGRTNAVVAMRVDADPNQCAICGARYQHHTIRRKLQQATLGSDGKYRYTDVYEPLLKDGKPVIANGQQVLVPVWETIRSPREDIFHDPIKHGVGAQNSDAFSDAESGAAA